MEVSASYLMTTGDVEVLSKTNLPYLECLVMKCQPYFVQREFSSVILTEVYISFQANSAGVLNGLTSAGMKRAS